MFTNPIYLIYIYKLDLEFNNLQGLICQNQTNLHIKTNESYYLIPYNSRADVCY